MLALLSFKHFWEVRVLLSTLSNNFLKEVLLLLRHAACLPCALERGWTFFRSWGESKFQLVSESPLRGIWDIHYRHLSRFVQAIGRFWAIFLAVIFCPFLLSLAVANL